MEATIRFKSQGSPEDHLVSFSFEDVRMADLGAVLGHLPEALAKAYANTIAAQGCPSDEEAVAIMEKFILDRYISRTSPADNAPGQRSPNTIPGTR